MNSEHKKHCHEVLGLMQKYEVSIKDLSFVIAEFSLDGNLREVQQKLKGFLYPNQNIIEPET